MKILKNGHRPGKINSTVFVLLHEGSCPAKDWVMDAPALIDLVRCIKPRQTIVIRPEDWMSYREDFGAYNNQTDRDSFAQINHPQGELR